MSPAERISDARLAARIADYEARSAGQTRFVGQEPTSLDELLMICRELQELRAERAFERADWFWDGDNEDPGGACDTPIEVLEISGLTGLVTEVHGARRMGHRFGFLWPDTEGNETAYWRASREEALATLSELKRTQPLEDDE